MSKSAGLSIVVIAGIGLFGLGFLAGEASVPEVEKVSGLTGKDNQIATLVDFEPFWKAWNILNERYVPANVSSTTSTEKSLFTQKLVWGAISGLSTALDDPYTMFLPPTESEIFKEDISGNFSGVGMEIGIRNDALTVIAPLKYSPAERNGVRSGDRILEIDNKTTQGLRVDEAVSRIRGPEGTPVTLLLQRDEKEPFAVTITRAVIDLPTLDVETIESSVGKVFIIRLYNFSAASPDLFRRALQKFIDANTDKLVIDLRGNPGGYLEAAVDMASFFLPAGKVVVREYFGPDDPEEFHRSKGYDIFNENLKLTILVDGGSASASEILAGALREYDKAKLVGTKTFGKGSVQELVDITPETSLKVTVARWLTPEGISISEKGLEPDFAVEVTEEDVKKDRDPQLEKAIEVLGAK